MTLSDADAVTKVMTDATGKLIDLLKYAYHLRLHGQNEVENWDDWQQETEQFLKDGIVVLEPVDWSSWKYNE